MKTHNLHLLDLLHSQPCWGAKRRNAAAMPDALTGSDQTVSPTK